ncbi:MAG: YidC/Oxa1 family membrane protein insertase [Clostridia bacterium]|nr:YidC/Oxa1 family membrane protein insertase [Clostridia bacterium]
MQGLFDLINIPFSWVIRFFYGLTDNYMIALLLFAIVVKLVLFPIGIKTQKNMVKQASLRPKEAAIRAKYAGRTDQATQQKMQNEIMSLYQSENYNPAGGCLPMILQLIVVWAIYQIVYGPLTYLCGMSAEALTLLREGVKAVLEVETYTGNEIQLLHDIAVEGVQKVVEILPNIEGYTAELGASIEDILVNHWPNMTVFGGALDLSETPSIAINVLLLIPILNLVTTWASTKITRKFSYQSPDQAEQMNSSMKMMEITMPLMIFWMAFQLPAALGVYWIFQNVLGVLQSFILSKMYPYPKFTDEELKAAVKEINQGASKKDRKPESRQSGNGQKGKVRSLHHIDDEDYEDEPAPQTKNKKKSAAPTAEESDAAAEDKSGAADESAADDNNDDGSPVGYAPLKDDDRHK